MAAAASGTYGARRRQLAVLALQVRQRRVAAFAGVHIQRAEAAAAGIRRGEPLALRWSNVDLDGAKLHGFKALDETRKGRATTTNGR